MEDLEIITTSDGSHTLRNRKLNETYHSIHGAMQESLHVFIKNGLEYFSKSRDIKNISILEVGFGTGLNALLTWQYATRCNVAVRYTTLEPFPLPPEVWSRLNYAERDGVEPHFRTLHEAGWNSDVLMAPEFIVLKIDRSLQEVKLTDAYDVIYFDAFAPAIQPELWDYVAMEKVVSVLKKDGVFVTYSAKGQLKRDLKSLGLTVETLPGPPGKNEMVRGRRLM